MSKAHIYAGLAARFSGVPVICFEMGLPDGGLVDRIARLIAGNGTLTCSEFAAQEQRRVGSRRVIAVPLGMDTQRFNIVKLKKATEIRNDFGLPSNAALIGIVGRLQHWKGMHVFLEAIAVISKSLPEIRGVVVGGVHDMEPAYPAYLKAQVARLGLGDRVIFAGSQRNVQEWMQAMDVVVHASYREPFGIVVVEAMALGKPVVASVPGGPEEIIRHQVDGLLVKSGDAMELASAIRRYLEEPRLAFRCGEEAKMRAEEFTAARFVERFERAIDTLTKASAAVCV
jgi:glycosyltransferase involved in cell wall biosynthesis